MRATVELEQPYETAFARSCGFDSYGEIIDASEPVTAADGELWYLTPLPTGRWLAWPFPALDDTHQFDSYGDSVEFIRPSVLEELQEAECAAQVDFSLKWRGQRSPLCERLV